MRLEIELEKLPYNGIGKDNVDVKNQILVLHCGAAAAES